jgi:hypothetical protein
MCQQVKIEAKCFHPLPICKLNSRLLCLPILLLFLSLSSLLSLLTRDCFGHFDFSFSINFNGLFLAIKKKICVATLWHRQEGLDLDVCILREDNEDLYYLDLYVTPPIWTCFLFRKWLIFLFERTSKQFVCVEYSILVCVECEPTFFATS